MSTPTLREGEMSTTAWPKASIVTTARKMAKRRYHYVIGAWLIWAPAGDGPREPVRMAVYTLCRNWVGLPVLVKDASHTEICDLCMLQQSREWEARKTTGPVDF